MKIAFVHDWEPDKYQEMTWMDGLAAALRELRRRGHEVRLFTNGHEPDYTENELNTVEFTPTIVQDVAGMKPDVILCWADFTREHAKPLRELGIPMAICFAGGEAVNYNTPYFDHIFVESQIYKDKLESAGYDNVSIAFGTNTELFRPIHQSKTFDTIFPATFAKWKRHDLYSKAVAGLRSLAVGYIYTDHETECWEVCIANGTTVLPHVSAETLHWLYAASKVAVITSQSDGGSQRTVLEAMAMNLPLVVTDSDKFDYVDGRDDVWQVGPHESEIREVVDFILDNKITVNTRDYVLENWSEYTYADALEKGLKSIL